MSEQSAPTPGDGADHGANDGTDQGTTGSGPGGTNRPHGEPSRTGRDAIRVAVPGGR